LLAEETVDATKQERRKWMAAGVLVALAAFLTARAVFDFDSAKPPASASSTLESTIKDGGGKKSGDFAFLDPTLHYATLELIENERYGGSGRNIFGLDLESRTTKISPPPEPMPPPPRIQPALEQIRLKFFGFASIFNSPRRVFLIEGDDIFVATEGEIVNRRYRIYRINSDSVQVEDLIEHSVHTLTLAG
jgi:hypothetical protein